MKKLISLLLAVGMLFGMCAATAEGAPEDDPAAFTVGGVRVTASELEAETRLYLFLAALECAEYGEDYYILDPENIDDRADLAVMDMEEHIANRILAEEASVGTLSAADEEAIRESAHEEWERYRGIAWSDYGMAFLPAGEYEFVDEDPEGNITRYFASFGLTEEALVRFAREDLISDRVRESVIAGLADKSRDDQINYYVQWYFRKLEEIGVEEDAEVIASVKEKIAGDPDEEPGDDFEGFELGILINDEWYELGYSTLSDFTEYGWTWEQEADGVYAFEVPETGSWFYVRTENDSAEGKIVMIDLMWADGLDVSYQGVNAGTNAGDEEESMWDFLEAYYETEVNDDGTLQAWQEFSDGRRLLIETKDRTVRLTLVSGE